MTKMVKNPPPIQETKVQSLGQEDPLEKGMATHFSIIVWRIPWTEEPGRLYNPWGPGELDTTEQLTLSLFFFRNRVNQFHWIEDLCCRKEGQKGSLGVCKHSHKYLVHAF